MQVLTGQYPTLYTHKFKIDYTDFQPSTTFSNQFTFLTLAKTVQVVQVQIYCLTPFAGTGITNATIRIFDAAELPSASLLTGMFTQCVVFGAHSTKMGANQWIQPRARVTAPTTQSIICGMVSPTDLSCRLVLPTGQIINNLTAGSVWVWVTVMKLP